MIKRLLGAGLMLLHLSGSVLAQEGEATSQPAAVAPIEPPQHKEKMTRHRLGGHVGLGLPFLTVGSPGASFIGRDFAALGIVAGINLGLTDRWSIDFEFIAIADFLGASTGVSQMTFVLDPGVVYNWGPLWTGLRIAMRVPGGRGGAEFGFVPIIGKAWKLNEHVSYYVELDLPVFLYAPAAITLTAFVQTGLGF